MSFGGSVAGMIASLKANKRSKGDNLFKMFGILEIALVFSKIACVL